VRPVVWYKFTNGSEVLAASFIRVNSYQTIRRNNSKDSHLQTRRRENLKSHNEVVFTSSTLSLSTGNYSKIRKGSLVKSKASPEYLKSDMLTADFAPYLFFFLLN
jgi:hypothetical protein